MVRYYHFCARCPDIRIAKMKRKTNLCSDCSRRWRDKKMDKYEFDLKAMIIKCIPRIRYYRICPECPPETNTKQVGRKALSGIKLCTKCNGKATGSANKGITKEYKPRKTRRKVFSEAALAIMREEREFRARKEAAKEVIPQLKEVDSKRMQEEFIRKRNVIYRTNGSRAKRTYNKEKWTAGLYKVGEVQKLRRGYPRVDGYAVSSYGRV